MSGSRLRLLIIGGYGVFGGRLAELLADEPRLTLLIGGRSLAKAEAFCLELAAAADVRAVRFDRAGNIAAQFAEITPDVVVDASGPFQDYTGDPYTVVRAALAKGVHYLDLADGSEFVDGVAQFDDAARDADIYVLSGVSSFPVLTAAVVRHLTADMQDVRTIRAGIAPSPYAGVGLNVIKAISSYAGKPVALTRDGAPTTAYGLCETARYTIAPPGELPLRYTLFSLVDVPDLRLLPKAWPDVRSIWMGAGPVPEILHHMLIALARGVRRGLLPPLSFAAPLFHRVINVIRWGEHRGGMFVEAAGTLPDGRAGLRSWHLLAEGSDGPYIPSMAVEAIIRKQVAGSRPASGARSAIAALELSDYRAIFANRTITEGIRNEDDGQRTADVPLFQRILGTAWRRLAPAVQTMHEPGDRLLASGVSDVARGGNPLTWLIGAVFRFPPSGRDVPVVVEIRREGAGEVWSRTFGTSSFSSHLSEGRGRSERLVCERFGPFVFGLALVVDDNRLRFVTRNWSVFGIPLPGFAAPYGDTYESVDELGRFTFDVEIKLPLLGRLVSYRGHLTPREAEHQPLNSQR